MKKIFSVLICILISGVILQSKAQQINRDVVVVKPYEPSLSDAYKISVLPKIEDSASVTPKFDYSILPAKIDAPFELKPINAARMLGTPLEKLYTSYIMLGMGNFFTPVAEYNINSLRSKNSLLGFYYMHKSSGSKIKLDNEDKVPAGYSINKAELYANKFYDHSNLSGIFRFRSDVVHDYGYNTLLFPDTTLDIKGKNIKQSYSRAGISLRYNSTYSDSDHLNYDLNLNYDNFNDKHNNYENQLALNALLNKRFGNKMFGIDLGFNYVKPSIFIDSASTSLFSASPYFSKKNTDYEFRVGGRVYAASGGEKNVFFYPWARLQFNVVEKILMPYVGIDGDASLITYNRLSAENPYIIPASSSEIMDKLYVYGGIKGLFSSTSGFDLSVSYSLINNMPLFLNDTLGKYDNMFKVISDDAELVKYAGEVYYDPYTNLKLSLKASLFDYKMSNELKAWHKPDFELSLNTKYNIREKIFANLNIIAIGNRYAKIPDSMNSVVKLKPVIDVNLELEYKYSKILSFYLNFYNLTSSNYFLWNQYPGRKLNVIVGFSYKI